MISDDDARAAVERLLEDLSRCRLRFTVCEDDAFVELLGFLPLGVDPSTVKRWPVKVDNLGDKIAALLHEPQTWKPEQRRALAELLEAVGYEGS